jgi:metallophosphoesterase superfamily enzyme
MNCLHTNWHEKEKNMPERNKTIFISDIHLGDQRSWEAKPHPYCWFMDNINKLALFLTEIRKDASVKELVILGDLFDTWIIIPAGEKGPRNSRFESDQG